MVKDHRVAPVECECECRGLASPLTCGMLLCCDTYRKASSSVCNVGHVDHSFLKYYEGRVKVLKAHRGLGDVSYLVKDPCLPFRKSVQALAPFKLSIALHAWDPSTQKAKAGRLL